MHYEKNRIVFIYIAIILVIFFAGNTIRHFSPVTLDADYLTKVTMSFTTPYEKLIYTHEWVQGNGVICFVTIANDNQNFDMVYLEKRKSQYSYKYKNLDVM